MKRIAWPLIVLLLGCTSNSKGDKDQRSKLIGMDEGFLYACAGYPTAKIQNEKYELVTISYPNSNSKSGRDIATETKPECKAKVKVKNQKVTQIMLSPKGSTVSRRHPACYALFERCLVSEWKPSGSSWGSDFGSGLMNGIIDGLKRANERLNGK